MHTAAAEAAAMTHLAEEYILIAEPLISQVRHLLLAVCQQPLNALPDDLHRKIHHGGNR